MKRELAVFCLTLIGGEAGAASARCDVQPTQLDRAVLAMHAKSAAPSASIFASSFESHTAKIVLHVLEGPGGAGRLGDEQIDAQLAVLNEAFATTPLRFEF